MATLLRRNTAQRPRVQRDKMLMMLMSCFGGAVLTIGFVYNRMIKRREQCEEEWHNLLGETHAWLVSGEETGAMEADRGFVPAQLAELRLQKALRRYNEKVRTYNELVGSFPTKWFAELSDRERYGYAEVRDSWLVGGPPGLDTGSPTVALLPRFTERGIVNTTIARQEDPNA